MVVTKGFLTTHLCFPADFSLGWMSHTFPLPFCSLWKRLLVMAQISTE